MLGFVCAPGVDVHDLLLANVGVELRVESGLGTLLLVVLLLNVGLGHGSILLQLIFLKSGYDFASCKIEASPYGSCWE